MGDAEPVSKTHASRKGGFPGAKVLVCLSDDPGEPGGFPVVAPQRVSLEQGLPWVLFAGRVLAFQPLLLLLLGLLLALPAGARDNSTCPGPAWRVVARAPGVWQVLGEASSGHDEADVANRGRVSNALLVRDGARLWLLGSGPSPAAGAALACQVRAQLKRPVTDIIAPWPRPELVLGAGGFPLTRHWGHAEVAQGMQRQCPTCVERLRLRLGAAASDLGDRPIHLPEGWVTGASGSLGPLDWQLLWRAEGRPVTVWRVRGQPLFSAHGLLWGDGPPDARDAQLPQLLQSTEALARWAAAVPQARWLPEQGPLLGADAPARHAAYWQELQRQAQQAVQRGDAAGGPPPRWPGLPDAWATHVRHTLNWQHAWREAEDAMFNATPR
ncbi:hypothetical protein BurJ1DRAFT_1111 [Burkholderiales bacterium JOSHI_001]|nr:hypothetical protein BurJ1DRAFT_1111 [Burkholderiales bacterium JOSHI_001]